MPPLVAHTVDLDNDTFAPLAMADIITDLEPNRLGSRGRLVGSGERRLDDIVGVGIPTAATEGAARRISLPPPPPKVRPPPLRSRRERSMRVPPISLINSTESRRETTRRVVLGLTVHHAAPRW